MVDDIAHLVTAGRDGDLTAYGELVRRFQDMAYGYARSLLGDAHLAEDAVQEAFLSAYRHLGDLHQPAAFPGWLRRIVWRQCDRLGRRKQPRPVGLDRAQATPDPREGPAERAQQQELTRRVMAAIQRLPERQREVTTLFYVNGYSQAEVSAFLEVPPTTVKSRLHAARRNLTKELVEMVKHTLHEEKPGPELPRQVLRRLVKEAEQARDVNDYGRLMRLCDEALEQMGGVRPSRRREADTSRLLMWRGEAKAFGAHSPAAARDDYARALEIAGAIGDREGQRKALQALLITSGNAGAWADLRRWADRGRTILAEPSQDDRHADEMLLGQCEAAYDLATRAARHWRPGRNGGFTLGSVAVRRRGGKVRLLDPAVKRGPGGPCDVLLSLSQGTPTYVSVLMLLRPVLNSLPRPLRVGAEGRCRLEPIGTRRALIEEAELGHVNARTRVESARETVQTPAGRFKRCRKLVTTITPPPAFRPALVHHAHILGTLTGTITSWLAPGVGVVRLEWRGKGRADHDAVLTRSELRAGGTEPLPLRVGNTWHYSWSGELWTGVREVCRVIGAGGTGWRIATSSEAVPLSPRQIRAEHRRRRKARDRAQPKAASVRRRLRRGPPKGADPVRFHERLLADAAGAKDPDLRRHALMPLALALREGGNSRRAEEVFAEALSARPNPRADAEALAYSQSSIALRCLEQRQFDWAREAGRRCLEAWTSAGLKDGLANGQGLALLAEALAEDAQAGRIAGYATALIELPRKARTVIVGGGGYSTGALGEALRGRPGWMSLTLANERLLLLPVKVGRSWSDSGNFGDGKVGRRRTITRTTEAVDDTVTVPAGRFRHCVRVRSDADLSPFTPATPIDETLLGWVRGPRLDWYAAGVGLVKMEHRHANGQVTCAELAEYAVRGGQRSCLPGRVGNRWHYVWLDDRGRVWGHNLLLVASRHRKTGYLASAGYWYDPDAKTKSGRGADAAR